MAGTQKSVWRIVWDFCGHFSTAIWIGSIVMGGIVWFISLPPFITGGAASLLLALSLISVANKVQANSRTTFLSLDLGTPNAARPYARRKTPHTKAAPIKVASNVEIGRLSCSLYSDDAGRIRGATITAENEETNRKYIATTDDQGGASLAVPHGNYSVTIEAENFLTRVEAVRVTDHFAHLHNGRLQMKDEPRKALVTESVHQIINELAEFSEEGNGLLQKARYDWAASVAMQEETSHWEAKVADYLKRRLSRAEEILFLSESPVEVYLIAAATNAHRSILNRINTRVVRLNRLINRLGDQLNRGMLF